MKKKLYYTVKKELSSFDDNVEVEETTGNKTITCYDIVDNQPKIFCEIESLNTLNLEEEIQTYLDNNGYGDDEFELIIL